MKWYANREYSQEKTVAITTKSGLLVKIDFGC